MRVSFGPPPPGPTEERGQLADDQERCASPSGCLRPTSWPRTDWRGSGASWLFVPLDPAALGQRMGDRSRPSLRKGSVPCTAEYAGWEQCSSAMTGKSPHRGWCRDLAEPPSYLPYSVLKAARAFAEDFCAASRRRCSDRLLAACSLCSERVLSPLP